MTINPGENLPTAVPIPLVANHTADEQLENPVEGIDGGLSEQQAGLSSEGSFLVTNKVLTSNVATLTIGAGHGLLVGDTILVQGVDAVFDGTYTVSAVAATTVSYALTHANVGTAASSGGTLIGVNLVRGLQVPGSVDVIQPAANQALPNTDPGITG